MHPSNHYKLLGVRQVHSPCLLPSLLHKCSQIKTLIVLAINVILLTSQSIPRPPMDTVSIRDVLSFHKLDRDIYELLVALGTSNDVARNVVALFMWLDIIGADVITFVQRNAQNHATILRLAAEAETILDCLRHDAPPRGGDSILVIPLTASLVSEPLSLRFFYYHRDVAIRGIAQLLDGVGVLIFDDHLNALLAKYEAALREAEGEARRQHSKLVRPELPAELAKPYRSRASSTPEDSRSMFITFSKGFPLRREDIVDYFTEKWGKCVERVMMEKTATGTTPMYGRIVFTSESFIGLVLNGEQLAKFVIKGKQLWARKYVPRKNAV